MNIFVGNLPYTTTRDDIDDLFRVHGRVRDVRLITDRESGRSKGFAFVTMPDPAEAQSAIEALNGSLVGGRTLRVNLADDRPPRRDTDRTRRF